MLYNSRITPINTVATSFVTKLCGKPTWDGLSSNQVFAGWIFDVPYWETVKMIEIKEKKAQELLGINGKWASFDDFWDNYNNYKLDAPLKKAYKDGDTKLQKQLRDADEKFNIIRMLYGGEMLKMFPYAGKQGHMQWFAPGLTMLIYSAPLHADIKWLRKAQHMHLYMLLAFLSVLMTYFGVNYFLSGMHSYA